MTVYVVLFENSFGSADVLGVFTERAPADALAAEVGGYAYAASVEEGPLDERWPERP
jgi:hypothetical protein